MDQLTNKIIKAKIRQARPKFKHAMPLIHKIVWGFIILNLCIAGAILWSPKTPPQLVIYNGLLTHSFWAGVFVILAILSWIGILRNSWSTIKNVLILGLLVKSIFLYALFYLGYQIGLASIIGTIFLWLFLVYIQVLAVIYFPVVGVINNDKHS